MKITKIFDKQNKKWESVVDYRGDDVWLKADGSKVVIDYLGELKAEHTTVKPPEPFYHEFKDGVWVENKDKKILYLLECLDNEYLPLLAELKEAWMAACLDDIPDNEKPIEAAYQAMVNEYTTKRKAIENGEEIELILQPQYFCKVCGTKMNQKNEHIYKCPKCGFERKVN